MIKNTVENESFDKEIMLCILKEEAYIDEMIALELRKQKDAKTFETVIVALPDYGIDIKNDAAQKLKIIYEIAKAEKIATKNYRVIKICTRSKIRSMIGKWNPPTQGQMKIGEVLEDIYVRTNMDYEQEVYYYTGKDKTGLSKGKYAYKLIVHRKMAFFVDLNRQILYHIIRG